ncbi:hypothetical protein QJS66_00855 [Kocuria rhizophila]|nr:hypothetical protein QJS66_00855 [Kocuria rhizophila]
MSCPGGRPPRRRPRGGSARSTGLRGSAGSGSSPRSASPGRLYVVAQDRRRRRLPPSRPCAPPWRPSRRSQNPPPWRSSKLVAAQPELRSARIAVLHGRRAPTKAGTMAFDAGEVDMLV